MSNIIDTIRGESENLPLHVDLCEKRYQQLIQKFETVDSRLDKIENMLVEINSKLHSNNTIWYKKYLSWSGAIILILIGIIASYFNR